MICSFHLTLLSFNVKLTFCAGIRGLLLWTGNPSNFDLIGHVNYFDSTIMQFLLLSINLLFISNWQTHSFFSEYQPRLFMCGVIWNMPFFFTNVSSSSFTVSEDIVKCCGDRHGFGCFGWLLCWPLLFAGSLSALPRRSQFIDNLSDMACSLSPRWVSAGPVASCRSESEGGTRSEEVFTCRAG